jgi:hypothetical protein
MHVKHVYAYIDTCTIHKIPGHNSEDPPSTNGIPPRSTISAIVVTSLAYASSNVKPGVISPISYMATFEISTPNSGLFKTPAPFFLMIFLDDDDDDDDDDVYLYKLRHMFSYRPARKA